MKKKYKTGLYVHYDPEAFEKEKHFSPKRQLRTLHTTLDRHPELIKVKEYIDLDDSSGDQKVFYEMLQDVYEGKIEWDTTKPNGTPRKLLDVSKATKLGWTYKTELEDGIRLAYKDFLENPMRAER